jgi:GntR family transcriptional repressor for pyruvate dehydrogenase complex
MSENFETSAYTLKVARKKRLYEEIVSQIQQLIETGELHSGDRLPPERKLAEMFKVSRNSVREAIKALEEKQILKSRPGDGTYVIVENEAAIIAPLAYALQLETTKMREIFQFRRMVEPQIANLAAENASQEDIDSLKVILFDQERQIASGDNSKELDRAFHLRLARATGNSVLYKIVNILSDILEESREELYQSKKRRIVSYKAHLKIVEAIEKNDPELAWQEMDHHLTGIERIVFNSSGKST